MVVNVKIGKNLFDSEWQKKTFNSENKAIEWIRRNYSIIQIINNVTTAGENISHYVIMQAIRNES